MKRLRIALLIDDFFPASGGIARSMQTQIEALTELGHDVTLLAPAKNLSVPEQCRTIACKSHHIDGLPAHLNVLHSSRWAARKIRERFDVVHSQTERGAVVLGARIARNQGVPHVHTFHANIAGTHATLPFSAMWGSLSYEYLVTRVLAVASGRSPRFYPTLPPATPEPDNNNYFSRLDWRSLGWIAAHVDEVTSPAAYMITNIENAVGQPIGGVQIPNACRRAKIEPVPAAQTDRGDVSVRFLSVGRLSREKRLDVLVKAFNHARIPGAELVFVGDGDQRDRLVRMAGPGVIFRGQLSSRADIAKEYAEADALVLASYRFDVQPMVLLEAGLAGLPVLYCDDRLTTGVSPESSLLVRPDAVSLAEGMRRLAEPDTRSALRANVARVVEGLTPESMAERYVEVYRTAIERGRRGG